MKSRKGFTLVELIIVIALLAIITAIGGVTFHSYTMNRNLKSAAREIVSDFFVYRARAVSEGKTYRIAFDIDGNSYTIQPGSSTPVTRSPLAFGSDIRIIAASFGCLARYLATASAFSECLTIRSGSVSNPCKSRNELNGD